ncbi:fatty acid desaturase [Tumidithrix elongata RA019]|uniref:Fatty acid desaturase n=1 Tax=Tumidithrix elongata BACA0141 TaxID=2716417 RepID=A0AAW9Q2I2_9CYAN|nr:fatty acid desaturase [Tumidithrix elongata RA019]
MAELSTTTLNFLEIKQLTKPQDSVYSTLVACLMISLWGISLGILLRLNFFDLGIWFVLSALLWQTFLYTGLFITIHDAMHGSVCMQNPQLNDWIGSLAAFCYSFFSYQELLRKHQLHHLYPASDRDPDFHDGQHKHLLAWYLHFMSHYWNWTQLMKVAAVFAMLCLIVKVSYLNLLLFWTVPPILSSMQLFYFGTFLPHREPKSGHQNSHRSQTNSLPVLWSLIACYHFGYHHEHHACPYIPWWRLPDVHRIFVKQCK